MHVYFGLNVDTGCPKLLHSPDMHEAVKPSLNRTEPSLNRNRKKMTAFPLGILTVSLVVLSSACGGLRSALCCFSCQPCCWFSCQFFCRYGCGCGPTAKSDPSSVGLQTRVEEYWQARIQGDAQRSLAYEHPDKRKRAGREPVIAPGVPPGSISGPSPLPTRTASSLWLTPRRRVCPYAYNINTCSLPGVKPMLVPTTIQDRWVKQDGVWYHVLDTTVIPVPKKNARQE